MEVYRLIEKFSLVQRVFAFIFWKTPLRRFVRGKFVNPYTQIVVEYEPRPPAAKENLSK